MTSLCFAKSETREIVYACGVRSDPLTGVELFFAEWQQWANNRDAVGRVCVGRDLGNTYTLDYLRGRYSPGMGWQEITADAGIALGKVFQREGLEFPWKPPHPWTTSMPC